MTTRPNRSCALLHALCLVTSLVVVLPVAGASADQYVAGYAAAIVERELGLVGLSVSVRDGVVTLGGRGLTAAERDRVRAALSPLPGVRRVEIRGAPAAGIAATATVPSPVSPRSYDTGWLPGGRLFEPLVADPRWPHFSASYQHYLDADVEHVGSATFGETFALYRGRIGDGWWEAGLQAGVFSIFQLGAESSDLVNTDYVVASTLAYRRGRFSVLGRLLHQSSHLGDEFLLRSRVNRINLSYEAADLKLSHELGPVRLYAGAGYIFRRDPRSLDPWSVQAGAEFRSPWLRGAQWRPIAAVDVQGREENRWSLDVSARAGIEFENVLSGRDIQLLLEYFGGHSPNGQFYRDQLEYIGLGIHFRF